MVHFEGGEREVKMEGRKGKGKEEKGRKKREKTPPHPTLHPHPK